MYLCGGEHQPISKLDWVIACPSSALLTFGRFSDGFQLHALSISLGERQCTALPFVQLEEVGIVISFAVHGLPCQKRVVSRTETAQAESTSLIGDGLTVTIDA